MKLDDLNYYLHDLNVPEARNSSEWAKHQFWTWYLIRRPEWSEPANLYDGLDYMLLMGWVYERFSVSHELPFALLYWDLRMPNIIIDGDDNLMAYHPTR